jgi:hypothetical protein
VQKPTVTLTEAYEGLAKKAHDLRTKSSVIAGKLEQLKKQREAHLKKLTAWGMKNPENAEARREFLAKRKKELKEQIDRKLEEIDEELDRLEQVERQIA